jgi:hypothetical protein
MPTISSRLILPNDSLKPKITNLPTSNYSSYTLSNKKNKIKPFPPTATTTTKNSLDQTGGLISSIISGFGLGVGQSIAHNTVSRIFNWGFGNSSTPPHKLIQSEKCDTLNKSFHDCMNLNHNDYTTCEQTFKMYESCIKGSNFN